MTERQSTDGRDEVEVAHEALIRHWPRLRAWLDQDRVALLLRESVREAAHEWARHDRDESYLAHRGRRLAEAEALTHHPRFTLNAHERAYLDACVALREREQTAAKAAQASRERLRRRAVVGLAAFSLLALVLAGVALWQRLEADRQRDDARRQATIALARALAAEVPSQLDARQEERAALLALQAYAYNERTAGPVRAQVDDALRAVMSVPHFSRILGGHEDLVLAVAFNRAGTMLASGGIGGSIQVWDLSRPGSAPSVLPGHDNRVESLAFSPDGTTLVSASRLDEKVRLWDLRQLEADPVVLQGYGNFGYGLGSGLTFGSVAFSPDGAILAVNGIEDDGSASLRLWNVRRLGDEPVVIGGGQDKITSFAFARAGESLALGTADGTVRLYPLPTAFDAGASHQSVDQVVWRDLGAPIEKMAVGPDGEMIALAVGQSIQLRNLAAPSDGPTTLPAEIGEVAGVAFSPDGQLVASANGPGPAEFADGTAWLWDLNQPDADPVVLRGQGETIEALAFSPDRSTLATGGDGTVRLWDLRKPIAVPGGIHIDDYPASSLAFSPNGTILASAGGYFPVGASHGSVSLWDLERHTRAAVLSLDVVPGSLVFSADGHTMAWSGSQDGSKDTIWLWSLDLADELEGTEDATPIIFQHTDAVYELAFSPDGKRLASGANGKVQFWDPGNPEAAPVELHTGIGTPVAQSGLNPNLITSVAFSPDGKRLVGGSQDGSIWLWDVSRPDVDPLMLRGNPEGRVNDLAFSPDGATLASSSSDATVRLWDLSRPSSNPVVLPHDEATTEVAFSGDGRTLATASVDGTVRLWDARRPTVSSLLQGHDEAPVGPVAFSPDGQTLASGSGDLDGPGGTIRFWMTTDALATAVCEQVWRNLTLSEWNLFVGEGMPYETTCRNLPPGEGAPPEGAGVMATPAVALADSPPPSIVQLPT